MKTTIIQYKHFPNATELGIANTHETYMLIPAGIDLTSLFPVSTEVSVRNTVDNKVYSLKSVSGSEFRVNQMGPIYRDYNVLPGDDILFTQICKGEKTFFFFEVTNRNAVQLVVSTKGVELFNVERLNDFKINNGHYLVSLGNEQFEIKFEKREKKRADSPIETDYYSALLNGTQLPKGTHCLILSKNNKLITFEKTNYNIVELDDSEIKDNLISDSESRYDGIMPLQQISYGPAPTSYTQFITAIKTKPFVLLAGISGTGKSRIVRQLARACDTIDENPWTVQKPANFEMIQVRPDWHDGSELLGYESRISGKGEYVVKEFVKFVVKAWIYEHEDVPFFLCLDEMNLAPVEQYFAEYLSVVETRKADKDGNITCDPLIKLNKEYCQSIANAIYPGSEGDAHDEEQLSNVENLMALLEGMDYCIPLPKNLIVMGTVNMDETTFGFSRKVLDRAMTIEMNEVDLAGGLEDTDKERFGIAAADILPTAVEGKDVYAENKELCDKVIGYLQQVNDVLEDTPFKIAYRTRNEFLVYTVNRGGDNLTEALDEMTSMKILSRIEGDQDKVGHVLEGLEQVMKDNGLAEEGLSLKKVKSMTQRLKSGYTSYWS